MPEAVSTSGPVLGPYSAAVKAAGLVFVSGQLGMKDGHLGATVEEQTRIALENMTAVLKNAGSSMSKVCKCSVYLKNIGDFAAVNDVYATFFTAFKPARLCCEVARLPKDALVEIECIAEQ